MLREDDPRKVAAYAGSAQPSSSASRTSGAWEPSEALRRLSGRLDLSADPAIELTIDAASLQTGNPKRDQHPRSADPFDADNPLQVRLASDSDVLQGTR